MPDQASSIAGAVDLLFYYLTAVSVLFSVLIFGLVFVFAVRFRRRESGNPLPPKPHETVILEIGWSLLPLLIVMSFFGWGTALYFSNSRVPSGATDIYVVGKQWMWKIQHPEGRREINELHVPVGQPIRLTMASEDVIHSFYIPAFRVKQDVVPGRYQTLWFEATQVGEYHLFCAEYCGTQHSGMIGTVYVMEPEDFQRWLEDDSALAPFEEGERLFVDANCSDCHRGGGPRGPALEGRFGRTVPLSDGRTVLFDEDYIRESILNPNAAITAGYDPFMPTYRGQLTEEEILQLVSYIRALSLPASAPAGEAAP